MSRLRDSTSPSSPSSSSQGWKYRQQSGCSHTIYSAVQTAEFPSHNLKPGRRRLGLHRYTTPSSTWLLALFVLAILCGISEAGINPIEYREVEEFARLEARGEILFDTRPAPTPLLYRRQDMLGDPSSAPAPASTSSLAGTKSSASASPKSSSPSTTTSSNSSTSTSSGSAPSSPVPSVPLPKPFDTSLSNNFTSTTCPDFFSSFLNNQTFVDCLPLSLLLQNSNSFFLAEKSITLITRTLDATCDVSFPVCSFLMSSLAASLRQDSNCGADYDDNNALVLQAYNGLLAYQPLYQAGCLKDSQGDYCFAKAVTNASSPADAYIYFLPLGIDLPGATRPTCSACLQQTMQLFADAASNLTQPVSGDYSAAAVQIDQGCGPTFVNSSVTPIQGTQPKSPAGRVSAASAFAVSVAVMIGGLLVWG